MKAILNIPAHKAKCTETATSQHVTSCVFRPCCITPEKKKIEQNENTWKIQLETVVFPWWSHCWKRYDIWENLFPLLGEQVLQQLPDVEKSLLVFYYWEYLNNPSPNHGKLTFFKDVVTVQLSQQWRIF